MSWRRAPIGQHRRCAVGGSGEAGGGGGTHAEEQESDRDGGATASSSGRQEERAPQQQHPPGLYLVSTPLGHLGDFSQRAVSVLRGSDLVLAENPRHSSVLLQHWGVTGVPLEAYHQHNERRMERRVLDLLARGSVVSLISDAGTPAISDPGSTIVRAAAEASYRVTTVPGPTALISALVGSGMDTSTFAFVGFLPPKAGPRRRRLEALQALQATLIFYVPPHDLLDVLADAAAALGAGRRCCVARELTKVHEEYWRSTLGEAAQEFGKRPAVRGEIVLVVEGAGEPEEAGDEEVLAALGAACAAGQPPSQAAKVVAAALGISKKRVYALSLQLGRSDSA
eukprot:scaffold3.g6170.t1